MAFECAYGLATGIVGGAVFALLLFGTVTKTLPSTRYTGFWTIHYFIATEVPIPSWVVVEYGYLVVAGISFLVGVFVLVESGIADRRPTPQIRRNDASSGLVSERVVTSALYCVRAAFQFRYCTSEMWPRARPGNRQLGSYQTPFGPNGGVVW